MPAARAIATIDTTAFARTKGTHKSHAVTSGIPDSWTWERDTQSEEWRYVLDVVGGTSSDERIERSNSQPVYSLKPHHSNDVRKMFSADVANDYESSKLIVLVRNDKLVLSQFFYKGKRWSFDYSVSDPEQGSRNYSVAVFDSSDLDRRIAAAKACAKTGECGE